MAACVPSDGWWRGRRVLVTGHTGFVGGWLCAWLAKMGARVAGYALAPPTTPSFFTLSRLESILDESLTGDVEDAVAVSRAIARLDPQVVFHLAAQPIVRDAYREPVAAFRTNVMGTVHILESCRARPSLEKLVVYTTDKVYRNDESGKALVEGCPLGGAEPYSASKASADWAVAAYWESYFRRASPRPAVAAVRAGNIVGGGDWARERLLPDAVRAFAAGLPLVVRSPDSIRPWQHVLDVVRGTLVLAERAQGEDEPGEALAWNFGPATGEVHTVAAVVGLAAKAWGKGASWRHEHDGSIAESRALVLASDKARRRLQWQCAWTLERAIEASVDWYRTALEGRGDLLELTHRQIEAHVADARQARA
jgi:CDP-glucose 4,6-dehydratase